MRRRHPYCRVKLMHRMVQTSSEMGKACSALAGQPSGSQEGQQLTQLRGDRGCNHKRNPTGELSSDLAKVQNYALLRTMACRCSFWGLDRKDREAVSVSRQGTTTRRPEHGRAIGFIRFPQLNLLCTIEHTECNIMRTCRVLEQYNIDMTK